jgi:hypothetical protein
MSVSGNCRLCGNPADSKAHVPPKSALNKRRWIAVDFETALRTDIEETPKRKQNQGGIYFETLCKRCNRFIGQNYDPELGRWFRNLGPMLRGVTGESMSFKVEKAFPSRLIRGVLGMFVAINPESFRTSPIGSDVVKLLSDTKLTGLPGDVRIFMYLSKGGNLRYLPFTARYSLSTQCAAMFSEIAYPPLGFVLGVRAFDVDERLLDVSHFADIDHNTNCTLEMTLPILPTWNSMLPTDYRTVPELRTAEMESISDALKYGENPFRIWPELAKRYPELAGALAESPDANPESR